jgi:hypothetical protein
MAGLETLRMFENKFTGPLPDSWSRMAALEELSLYNNPGLEGGWVCRVCGAYVLWA